MYVVRLHIPAKAASLEGAIYDTTFGTSNANSFFGQLKDICSSGVLEPFYLEYYSKDSCVYFCIAGEKETVDSVTSNIYGYLGNIEVVEISGTPVEYLYYGDHDELARSEYGPLP